MSDQLALATLLIERARRAAALTPPEHHWPEHHWPEHHWPEHHWPEHHWMDAAGIAPYPLTGEDAQAWVSRSRQEGDEEREQQWRPTT